MMWLAVHFPGRTLAIDDFDYVKSILRADGHGGYFADLNAESRVLERRDEFVLPVK